MCTLPRITLNVQQIAFLTMLLSLINIFLLSTQLRSTNLCPKMERKKQKLIEFVCTINVSNIWKCTRNMHKQRQFNKSLFTHLHSECVFALIFWYKHNNKHYLQTDFVPLRKMLLHSVITQRSRINRVKFSVIKYVIGLHIYLERTMIYKW